MIQSYSPSTFPRRQPRLGKTIEKWILYLVVLGIAGVSLYWFILGRGKEFEVSLVSTTGTVEYRTNEKDGWKTATSIPLKINQSSEIRTLADSEANFTISDGSRVNLGSYSRIVLSKNQGEIEWIQTDGDSHHQTAKNAERKGYKVSISDGYFESLGTAFEVKIRDTDTTVLVLKDQIRAVYKDKSTAEAKAGEEIVINPMGKKVQEISDQDLKDDWTLKNIKEDQKNNLLIDGSVLTKAGLEDSSKPTTESGQSSATDSNQTSISSTDSSTNTTNTNDNKGNTPGAGGETKINLEAKQSSNGVLLNWNSNKGEWDSWKILKGTSGDITYPSDSYRTIPKETNSYLWEINGDSNTYYFRVCAFKTGQGCVGYSDPVSSSAKGSSSATTDTTTSTTSNSNTSSSTSSDSQTQNTDSTKKSGVTTRKNCEDSGGHWSQSSSVCKCSPKEVFVTSVGRCKKQ